MIGWPCVLQLKRGDCEGGVEPQGKHGHADRDFFRGTESGYFTISFSEWK
jgi:hypothetical protein